MKSWLKGAWCALKGHKVIRGETCPVTGIQLITCSVCGDTNMPKHDNGSSFN